MSQTNSESDEYEVIDMSESDLLNDPELNQTESETDLLDYGDSESELVDYDESETDLLDYGDSESESNFNSQILELPQKYVDKMTTLGQEIYNELYNDVFSTILLSDKESELDKKNQRIKMLENRLEEITKQKDEDNQGLLNKIEELKEDQYKKINDMDLEYTNKIKELTMELCSQISIDNSNDDSRRESNLEIDSLMLENAELKKTNKSLESLKFSLENVEDKLIEDMNQYCLLIKEANLKISNNNEEIKSLNKIIKQKDNEINTISTGYFKIKESSNLLTISNNLYQSDNKNLNVRIEVLNERIHQLEISNKEQEVQINDLTATNNMNTLANACVTQQNNDGSKLKQVTKNHVLRETLSKTNIIDKDGFLYDHDGIKMSSLEAAQLDIISCATAKEYKRLQESKCPLDTNLENCGKKELQALKGYALFHKLDYQKVDMCKVTSSSGGIDVWSEYYINESVWFEYYERPKTKSSPKRSYNLRSRKRIKYN